MSNTNADEERIAKRYPQRSVWDYLVMGGIAIGIAAVIVAAYQWDLRGANPPFQAVVRSFTIDSPTEVSAELVVERTDPSLPIECRLFAQAETYETVGEQIVEVPGADDAIVNQHVTVKTVKEATSISVDTCWQVDE